MSGGLVCRSCGARIIFGTTERGRRMPVDVKPSPDGNVLLIHSPGTISRAVVIAPDSRAKYAGQLRTCHFATCPSAEKHRQRKA